MKKNQIILLAALGIGAAFLLKGTGSSGSGEQMFTLPDGRRVPISQLPSLGYVQYQGQWYHQSQLSTNNMPAGTDPNSTSWLNYLNTAIQTGQQLFVLGGSIMKSIKTTSAPDWNNSNVNIKVVYGYMTWTGTVNPTVNVTRTLTDQVIKITSGATQTKIQLIKAGRVEKEAIVDYFEETLVGFDAGSVGITGVYIGSAYSNIDTVTNMLGVSDPRQGIGSIYRYNHPKGLTHCQDGTYSDAAKGACSYHGGAHEIKLKKGSRDYTGKGKYMHYGDYRKKYKNSWARKNRGVSNDKIITL